MNDIIVGIVSGLITNGIQGIYEYVSKESLQDQIANIIDKTQNDFEKQYECKDKSLFIWEENIVYLSKWIKDGFLPRKSILFPKPYGADKSKPVSEEEITFVYKTLNSYIIENSQLCAMHASVVNDEIYQMLCRDKDRSINPDYYKYVESFGGVLLLHRKEHKKAITLKDTYILPTFTVMMSVQEINGLYVDIMELFSEKFKQAKQCVMLIEGDAGVGKSSLVSYICYQNELSIKETGKGIFEDKSIYCVRLRNLTMTKAFVEVPSPHIIESLGFQTESEYNVLAKKGILILDGYDELCMLEGMVESAEQVLAKIISDFSDFHIIVTSRPKFINISKLKNQKAYLDIDHIVLNHFDSVKRNEWINQYRNYCEEDEIERLDRIAQIDDDSSEGICDTPLALYMLAAGRISDAAWKNPWVLYNQIFYTELSNAEYNKLFSEKTYTHSISQFNDLLYRINADIAYEMYKTRNKRLYVTSKDINEIIGANALDVGNHFSLIKRCYALCNYWKNDGESGISEFYHNNIRDFFLCEKLYNVLEDVYDSFSEECLTNDQKLNETIDVFIKRLGECLKYSELNDKVIEFVYYRSLYKKSVHNVENFLNKELKYNFLAYFFEKMFIHGAIHDYAYDGKRSLFQENVNVLKCIIQIFRHLYEPYVRDGAKKIEWFLDLSPELGEMYGFPYLFNAIFIHTPLTISSEYCIPVAGYADFHIYDMRKANLRYGMFSYSKIEYCDFSDTILVSTDFSHAILNHSNFENADMRNSSLLGAEIKGCKFDNCILTGTVLPDGFCSDNQEEQYEHVLQFI